MSDYVCGNCGTTWLEGAIFCTSCNSPNKVSAAEPKNTGEVRVVETLISDEEMEVLRKNAKARKRILLTLKVLLIVFFIVIVSVKLYNQHLDKTVQEKTLVVVGFQWETSIEIYNIHGDVRTETLQGTGKNWHLPTVDINEGDAWKIPVRKYYVILQDEKREKSFPPFEISIEIWTALNFNQKITGHVDGLGNIHSVTVGFGK